MVRAWLKGLGERLFGGSEIAARGPRRATRLNLEALDARELPSVVTGTLYISPTYQAVKVGKPFTLTLSSSAGSADAGATVNLIINDDGHVETTVKTLGGDGTFSWSRSFNYAGTVTVTEDTTKDKGAFSYPDSIQVVPIVGIGQGGQPLHGAPTPYLHNPNSTLTGDQTTDLTLVAYNGDGTLASDYNGYVTLESSKPQVIKVDEGDAYLTDASGNTVETVGTLNSNNPNGGVMYQFHNGLASAEVNERRANPDPNNPILLTAYICDSSGNAVTNPDWSLMSSQGLWFYAQ